MTKREKLLKHAINNPKGLSFGEFQTLLRQEAKNGKAKGRQVAQFLTQYQESENGEEGSI
jgi:hypothetical protein